MIVSRDELEPIVNGKQTQVHLRLGKDQNPPAKGTFQAIQGAVGRKATCTVHIDDVTHHEEGGWLVTFHLADEVEPRFLGRKGGYVSDPAYGLVDEPQAVDSQTQESFTIDARTRAAHRRKKERTDQNRLSAEDRIKAYQREAKLKHISIGKELRVYEQLKRRGKDPSSQVHVIRRKLDDNQDKRAA
jgi:hypothetical protein